MDSIIICIPRDKGALLGKLVNDDLISRQTIAVREASGIGKETDDTYIMIEGSDESLKKAKDIAGEDAALIEGNEKDEIRERIQKAEEQVAEGLGFMFG